MPARMPERLDWLMQPVTRGMCRYSELIDGTLGVCDVARMNDAIAVADENERRAREARTSG